MGARVVTCVALATFGCTVEGRVDDGACPSGQTLVGGRCITAPNTAPVRDVLLANTPVQIDRAPPARCILRGPLEVDVGAVAVGLSGAARVALENASDTACVIQSISTAPGFIAGVAPPLTIAPNSTTFVPIRFVPDQARPYEARITFAADRASHTVRVFGHGTNTEVVLSPAQLDFGRRGAACRNAEIEALTLANRAATPVFVDVQLIGDDASAFTLESDPPGLVASGAVKTIRVGFAPQRLGHHAAQLALQAGTDLHYVWLSGEGMEGNAMDERFPGGVQRLHLDATPTNGSLVVLEDGVSIPPRYGNTLIWSLDYAARTVEFEQRFIPLETSEVVVRYAHLCVGEQCGDGMLNPGEACDDGNTNDNDFCTSNCVGAFCGDGFVLSGRETCDDGNLTIGDGCNDRCEVEVCGNGYLEAPEECDHGVANSDTQRDACRTDCQFAHCHDGTVDDGEICDDGNSDNDDGCVGLCVEATCGDGYVWSGVEECDDANTDDFDSCSNACTWASFETTSGNSTELSPPTGVIVAETSSVALPFIFNFLGRRVDRVDLRVPGVLVFGRADPSAAPELVAQSAPNGLLAWWWDAGLARAADSATYIDVEGDAPERIAILRFHRYAQDGQRVDAEVRLYEADLAVEITYGPSAEIAGSSAAIGWESFDGTRGADALGCSPTCGPGTWPGESTLRFER